MSAHAFTPGPWRIAPVSDYPYDDDGRINIDAETRGYVCLAGYRDDKEAIANARLIVAAPKLLEELIEEHKLAIRPEMHDPKYCQVCALIAEAGGAL